MYNKLEVTEAYTKALRTWAQWVDANIDSNRTRVFFRGFSASHFRYINNLILSFSHSFPSEFSWWHTSDGIVLDGGVAEVGSGIPVGTATARRGR